DERGAPRPAPERIDLDRDQETAERADRRAEQGQKMRRAPEGHVQPEQAMPEVVDRRGQDNEDQAQCGQPESARRPDAAPPLVREDAPSEREADDHAAVDHEVRRDPERVAPDGHVPLDVPGESPGGDELGGQRAPERHAPVSRRAAAHDCTTVTTRPIDARMLPTRTHSVSAPTLTTARPVLCTCQASSQPLASLQPIAFWSCFTTCSNVWQSQL